MGELKVEGERLRLGSHELNLKGVGVIHPEHTWACAKHVSFDSSTLAGDSVCVVIMWSGLLPLPRGQRGERRLLTKKCKPHLLCYIYPMCVIRYVQ